MSSGTRTSIRDSTAVADPAVLPLLVAVIGG